MSELPNSKAIVPVITVQVYNITQIQRGQYGKPFIAGDDYFLRRQWGIPAAKHSGDLEVDKGSEGSKGQTDL